MQNLLLALGTALVSIAVVVFIAVNWSRLDATVQGLVLVGFTGVAAAGSVGTARRRMPATAEALGVVAVALGLADVHAIRVGLAPEVEGLLFWAGGVAVVALGAMALGRAAHLQGATLLSALLVQVPLLLVLGAYDPRTLAWQLAVVAQAAVVAVLVRRGIGPRAARVAGATWAAFAVGVMTLLLLVDTYDVADWEVAVGSAAVASLSVLVGWLWRSRDAVVSVCGGLAATFSVVAVARGVAQVDDDPELVGAVVGVVGAVALAALLRLPRRVGLVPSLVVGATAAAATLPLVVPAAAMLIAASDAGRSGWGLDQQVRSAVVDDAVGLSLDARVIGLQLLDAVVLATIAIASRAVPRRRVPWVAVGLGTLLLVVSPLLVPVPVWAVSASGGAVALAAAGWLAVATRRGDDRGPAAAAALLAGAWSLAWATVALSSAFVVLVVLTFAALGLLLVGMAARDRVVASTSALLTVAGTSAAAGVAVAWAGGDDPWSWVAAAVASMVVVVLGVLLVDPGDRGEEPGRTVLLLAEAAGAWIHLLALIVVAPVADGAFTAVLATGAIGFSISAVRPSRRWLGIVAATEALLATWVQLDARDVTVVEAYTLPLAALLLAVGIAVDRRAARAGRPLPSWATLSAGIAVGLGPTVVLSITDPGSLRPLIGLVGGAAVLVVGAVTGRRAAVDLGAAAVVVLGVRQLAPWVGSLPNWMVIGATGVVLLVVGATFEQRRRDAREVRRRYSSLR